MTGFTLLKKLVCPSTLVAGLLLTLPPSTMAQKDGASCITCLGSLTTDLPGGPNLAFFRKGQPVLRHNRRPEMLVIGSQSNGWSAIENWALVKALSQFGTLSGLTPTSTPADSHYGFGGIPTYDFSRVAYQSRYVSLVYRDLATRDGTPLQHASAYEARLMRRFRGVGPFMLIGGYARGVSPLAPGELDAPSGSGLSFDSVVQDLQLHHARQQFVDEINVEANVLTALICHADRGMPTSVCSKGAVHTILQHIR